MKEERLLKILIVAVCVSFILSLFTIGSLFSFQLAHDVSISDISGVSYVRKRAIEEGDTEDVSPTVREELGCHDESLVFDLKTRRGYVNQKMHQLGCNLYEVQLQVEGWVIEFNSVMYLINEIGQNMQAARNNIITNQNQLQILFMLRDRSFNVTHQSIEDIDELRNVTSRLHTYLGDVILSQNVMFEALINRTNTLDDRLDAVNEYLTSPQTLPIPQPDLSEYNISDSSQYFGGGEVEILGLDNNHEVTQMLKTIDERSQENNKLLLVLQNSIAQFDSQIENLASEGWFNAPNGYQYYLSKAGFRTNSFIRSRRFCRNKKSDLAYVGIRDELIYRFLYINIIHPSRLSCVWVGLTDIESEGRWKWLDGLAVDEKWSNFRTKAPGLKAQSEDCAMIRAGYWSRANCAGNVKVCSFLCERKITQ